MGSFLEAWRPRNIDVVLWVVGLWGTGDICRIVGNCRVGSTRRSDQCLCLGFYDSFGCLIYSQRTCGTFNRAKQSHLSEEVRICVSSLWIFPHVMRVITSYIVQRLSGESLHKGLTDYWCHNGNTSNDCNLYSCFRHIRSSERKCQSSWAATCSKYHHISLLLLSRTSSRSLSRLQPRSKALWFLDGLLNRSGLAWCNCSNGCHSFRLVCWKTWKRWKGVGREYYRSSYKEFKISPH